MTTKKTVGYFQRLSPAFKNSIAGLKTAYQYEMAFKQEVLLFVMLTPVAWFIANGFVEFILLMSGLFSILITELLNSAIEAVVDRVGLERHELSGRAKDLGSAAVLIAIAYFILVWGYKLVEYFS
jgi:diacylglycerol kinase (ATP)